jgi:hypothetical protein
MQFSTGYIHLFFSTATMRDSPQANTTVHINPPIYAPKIAKRGTDFFCALKNIATNLRDFRSQALSGSLIPPVVMI